MRRLRSLLLLPLLAALGACGDAATAPTDHDLLGTWSLEPTPALLPDGGIRQMTVQFGPDGRYTLTATWVPGAGVQPLRYDKSVGSMTTTRGAIRFHPAGAVALGRSTAAAGDTGPDPFTWGLRQPVSYQVLGDQLVLHLPAPAQAPVVLTRRE
ncbi:MAG TPA: hypothetical protein VFS20_34205 [Longimicrobium sp.]|nr:hypothetical protein [Longimicrobium sp.]